MTFLTYYFKVFFLLLGREIFLACKAPSVFEVLFILNEQFPSGQGTTVTGTLIIPGNIYCPISFFFLERLAVLWGNTGRTKRRKKEEVGKDILWLKLVELFTV